MAVAFRTGTSSGNAAQVTTAVAAVPSGAAVDDIAVVFLGCWQSGATPTITPPAGFTLKGSSWTSGNAEAKNYIYWKRLTAADTGNYSFTLGASFWTTAQCALFSGCVTTGDPWDAVATPVTGTFGTVTTQSVTMTDANGGLFWAVYNDSAGTHTPPTSFTEIADADSGSCAYRIPGASGSQSSASGSISSSSASGAWLGALLSDIPLTPRESVALTHVGSSAWNIPASSATVSPTYPSGVQSGDCVYAILHIKPDTATVATPTNWSLVTSASGGSGTQAAGTGATRMHLYKRIASAAHSGAEAFTITGGSSPLGFMRAYRATGTNVLFTETTTSWSVTTASTTIGGTAGAGLDVAALDEINCVIGTTDDQSTTLSLTGLTATGATLGTITNDPSGTVVNAQGNDISANAYRIAVSSGTSNVAPVATATSSSSETAMGFLFRVRATADVAAAAAWWPRRRGPNYRR